ncbi:hypothetical protein BDV97DRAFT_411607 [Delphinella strobiligena]|nr:hypothetical protein BDV97DRAFT_411607 [Delphinella strobiligena]
MAPNNTNSTPSNREFTTDDITMRTSKGRRMYGCPYVGCSFENLVRRSVERHMESHQYIHTTTSVTGSLADHRNPNRRYSARRSNSNWQCPDCALDFPYLSRLKDHRRSHTDERPFECEACPYASSTKRVRDDHQKRHEHHAWPCYHCVYNGDSWRDVVSHMRTRHTNLKELGEARRRGVVTRTLEYREQVAAGISPRQHRRRGTVSQTSSVVLAAGAAADATLRVDAVTQEGTAEATEGEEGKVH